MIKTISVPPKPFPYPQKSQPPDATLKEEIKVFIIQPPDPHHMNTVINFFKTIRLLMVILGNG